MVVFYIEKHMVVLMVYSKNKWWYWCYSMDISWNIQKEIIDGIYQGEAD